MCREERAPPCPLCKMAMQWFSVISGWSCVKGCRQRHYWRGEKVKKR